MQRRIYSVAVLIIVLFAVNIFLVFKNSNFELPISQFVDNVSQEGKAYILPISEPNYIPILDSNVPKPVINAKSAIVFDTRSSRFLFEKDRELQLPIASLTKVMSAVVVLENLAMDGIVTISEDSIRVDGEKQDLYLGEKMSVRNLLRLALIESSNDAAYALASYAKEMGIDFVSKMNAKAGELDMADSHFIDPAGLNDNAYSTVQDLVKLVEYSLNYPEIWDISAEKTAIVESSDEKIKHTAQSTNRLIGLIKDLIGGKTGFTEGAGQCMILVTNAPDYPSKIISIVLGSHDRFGDTRKLMDWTRRAYRWE